MRTSRHLPLCPPRPRLTTTRPCGFPKPKGRVFGRSENSPVYSPLLPLSLFIALIPLCVSPSRLTTTRPWGFPKKQACLRRERESLDGRRRKFQDEKAMDEWANELSHEIDAEERMLDGLTRQDYQVGLVRA